MKRIKFFTSAGAIAMATLTLGSTLTFAATNSSITSNPNTSTGIHTPPTQGQQMGRKRPPAPISLSELAQALNINTSTLKSDLQSGQSILDIATQQGISESTLEQTLTTYVDSQLQAMVSSGKLSSTQVNTAEAAFAKRLPTMLSRKGLPPHSGQGLANGKRPANGQAPATGSANS